MNTVWMLVGLGVAGGLFAIVTAWQRRSGEPDLGAVSTQWIAEHRFGQGNDQRR